MTEKVTSRLSDLETPLRKSQGLTYAVRAFANSGELGPEGPQPLDALATSLLDELTEIFVEWESIMGAIHKGDPA